MNLVTGSFNNLLENKLFVCLEEALCTGDKKEANNMKALLTEDWINLNMKHVSAWQGQNFLRFMMLSNEEHVVAAGPNSRRYVCFETSPVRRGDLTYFQQVNAQLQDDDCMRSFAYALLTRDISQFGRGQRFPVTTLLKTQQLLNMTDFEFWWKNCLETGQHVAPSECNDDISRNPRSPWVELVAFDDLYHKFGSENNSTGALNSIGNNRFTQAFKTICNTVREERKLVVRFNTSNGVRTSAQKRIKYFHIPPLQECRRLMQAKYVNLEFEEQEGEGIAETPRERSQREAQPWLTNATAEDIAEEVAPGKIQALIKALKRKGEEYNSSQTSASISKKPCF